MAKSAAKPADPLTANPAPEPDLDRAIGLVMEMMAIPGPSGQEGRVVEFVRQRLLAAGAREQDLRVDNANRKTPSGGEVGNLVFKLPGTLRGPRKLLMAHLDTVPICVGSRPVRRGEIVESSDPNTGLGADDRAGAAVILTAALEILKCGLPHPPLVFFWPVQEEVGLMGARYAQLSLLGKPQQAFNFDGGLVERVTIGATGGYRLKIHVEGLASHAGGAPEAGISAIAIAALAIAELQQNGWHGLIEKGRRRGTSNVGYIHGGAATNVVTDSVELKAEARSHDPKFREQIVRTIEQAFRKAARRVKNSAGRHGKVDFEGRLDYEAFRLEEEEPCVLAAESALRSLGIEPVRHVSNGGLDANWMTAHGIPAVTLGCGQQEIHTTNEKLDLQAYRQACRLALRLATSSG